MPVDKSAIGRTGEPVTMHVERGKIQEFARAIKDDDPLYYDAAHATKEAGGIMPPVTFLQTVAHWDDGRGRPRLPFDLKRTDVKTKKVDDKGVSDVRNELGAFTVVRAASHEAAAKMFENHPHFSIFPGERVEIMPVLPIPAG